MAISREAIEAIVDAAIRRHVPLELSRDIRDFNDKLQRMCDGIIAMDEKIDSLSKRLQIVERALEALQDGPHRSTKAKAPMRVPPE